MKRRQAMKKQLGCAALLVAVFGYAGIAPAANTEVVAGENRGAAVCKNTAASLRCGDGLMEEINNAGNVDLKGTIVSGDTVISGSFKAIDAKLGALQVAGWSNIDSSVIGGLATITGSTKLHDSQFEKALHVTGNLNSAHDTFASDLVVTGKVKLDGSEVQGVLTAASREMTFTGAQLNRLEIKPVGSVKSKQVVYLQDHTVVSGDINFASGRGAVFVGSGSAINGKVSGGEVLEAG